MDVQQIALDENTARELWREYRGVRHYGERLDKEIRRAYQLIAQGRMVIKALESIRLAGSNDQGLPKLALCPAHVTGCHAEMWMDGSARFTSIDRRWARDKATRFEFRSGSFPRISRHLSGDALRPTVPLHMRPKTGIENYHVLWEAEWQPVPVADPYLLRRIGDSDMWLVVAAWDLTEVERAALATRLNG